MTVQERKIRGLGLRSRAKFYIDKTPEPDGTYLVHCPGCRHFPKAAIYLGVFASPSEALRKARRYYTCVSRCRICCGEM